LQSVSLSSIFNFVDNNPSTVGYEILSEPEVHSADQWKKIGKYNTFMVDKLREVTKKDIIFSMAITVDFNSIIGVNAQNIAKMSLEMPCLWELESLIDIFIHLESVTNCANFIISI
jgi:hypothetical protein